MGPSLWEYDTLESVRLVYRPNHSGLAPETKAFSSSSRAAPEYVYALPKTHLKERPGPIYTRAKQPPPQTGHKTIKTSVLDGSLGF